MRQIRFFNIEWDTDGEKIDLPQNVTLQVEADFDVAIDGADLLSDRYGFCIFEFDFEEVS